VGWLLDRLNKKPLPVSPAELERQNRECERILEEARLAKVRREQEREEELAEWRSGYSKYLRSKKWKRTRKKVLERADGMCEYCGKAPAVHVHHVKYPAGHRRGEFKRENYDYLVALCAGCHMKEHHL